MYLGLVRGWFRCYLRLVQGFFRVGSCLFNKCSLGIFRVCLRLVYGFLGLA